jgi:pimeloyl-ACP methyl ester carboxylesterase
VSEAVVLLHGIWTGAWLMRPLARRLRRCGYTTYLFSYPSVRQSPGQNAARLNAFLRDTDASTIHFVAHSLGGLVVTRLLNDFPEQRPGRSVLLGSPLGGSLSARRLNRWAAGRWLLGRSVERGLLGGGPAWPGGREVGVIAGSLGLGVGMLLGGLGAPGDGAVTVAETDVPGATDRITLRASHTGLLLSRIAARQTCRFLRHGAFVHS